MFFYRRIFNIILNQNTYFDKKFLSVFGSKMKARVSQKEIRERIKPYCFGYCEIQYLLMEENPIYYTAGIYGRNSDVYYIEDIGYIETGYRTSGNINKIPYKITQHYNNLAQKYRQKHNRKSIKKHNRFLLIKMIQKGKHEKNEKKK